jgi:hypothetical protein
MARDLVALALLCGLTGCAGTGPPTAFEERPPLMSCGTVTVAHAEPAGPEVDCFAEAIEDGRAAELVVRGTTIEGDPVVDYYRTVPGTPGIEVFHDATQDAFGSGTWEHYRCLGGGVDDLRDCAEE